MPKMKRGLVSGAVAVLVGWISLADTKGISQTIFGCTINDYYVKNGPCVVSSGFGMAVVQIAGMALVVGGVVAVIVGAINYRTTQSAQPVTSAPVLPTQLALRRYLELAQEYGEVLITFPLGDKHAMSGIRVPSFVEFLEERGHTALANWVRGGLQLHAAMRDSSPSKPQAPEVVHGYTQPHPHSSEPSPPPPVQGTTIPREDIQRRASEWAERIIKS